jgi:hypothetical protein
MSPSHRILVSSSKSPSGIAWTVFLAGESQAIFTGDGAKGRAIEAALRRAEELRWSASVLVVVESPNGEESATRVVRSKLAS